MLEKINKKRRINFQISKFNFSKIFTYKILEVSNRPIKNLNWLKRLKEIFELIKKNTK